MTHPYRRSRFFRAALPEANVSESGNIRSLHLGTTTIQSALNLKNPAELVLSYSRAMMGWLLFADTLPQHILQIGLGGGSFARWLAEMLPNSRQTAVEINPQVINIARSQFHLPPEDGRFEIIEADGAEYVKILRSSSDLIMVDGFDGVQICDELVSESFFADCRTALSDKGIFVTNWWSGDKRYAMFVERLKKTFNGAVIELPAESHGNMAVLAFQNPPANLHFDTLKKRAAQLSDRYQLDFRRMFADAKAHNPHNGRQFNFN